MDRNLCELRLIKLDTQHRQAQKKVGKSELSVSSVAFVSCRLELLMKAIVLAKALAFQLFFTSGCAMQQNRGLFQVAAIFFPYLIN